MKFVLYASLFITLFSCRKDADFDNTIDIKGRWKLTERYDNYKNPAVFEWTVQPDSSTVVMGFDDKKQYTLTHNGNLIYQGHFTIDENKVTIGQPDGAADYTFYIVNYNSQKLEVAYTSNGNVYKQKLVKL
jgi:Lipocalin-like domain